MRNGSPVCWTAVPEGLAKGRLQTLSSFVVRCSCDVHVCVDNCAMVGDVISDLKKCTQKLQVTIAHALLVLL